MNRFGIFLHPDYCYKFGPIGTNKYDSILGPFYKGEDVFILSFNRETTGVLNEIASSLLKETVYGEALITRYQGSCVSEDIPIFRKIVEKYTDHSSPT